MFYLTTQPVVGQPWQAKFTYTNVNGNGGNGGAFVLQMGTTAPTPPATTSWANPAPARASRSAQLNPIYHGVPYTSAEIVWNINGGSQVDFTTRTNSNTSTPTGNGVNLDAANSPVNFTVSYDGVSTMYLTAQQGSSVWTQLYTGANLAAALASPAGGLAYVGFTGGNGFTSGSYTEQDLSNFSLSYQNLPAATPVNLTAAGATLDLNGFPQEIGSLSGVAASQVSLGGAILNTGGDNTSTTFAGSISGGGVVVKTGTGTFTLSASNSYAGGTVLNGGAIVAQTNYALGTGPLTINPAEGSAKVYFTSASPSVSSLASAGEADLRSGSAAVVLGNVSGSSSTTLTVGSDNTSTTFAGSISDAGPSPAVGAGQDGHGRDGPVRQQHLFGRHHRAKRRPVCLHPGLAAPLCHPRRGLRDGQQHTGGERGRHGRVRPGRPRQLVERQRGQLRPRNGLRDRHHECPGQRLRVCQQHQRRIGACQTGHRRAGLDRLEHLHGRHGDQRRHAAIGQRWDPGSGQDGSLATGSVTNNAALVYNLAGSQTVGYPISGSGGLTKTGAGTLVLIGSNTYTGATVISGGTLQLGNGGAPSGSGQDGSLATGSLTNNAVLVYNLAGSQSVGYPISGSGGLTKTGSGTLVLTTGNTYSGPTVVNQGTVRLLSSAAAGYRYYQLYVLGNGGDGYNQMSELHYYANGVWVKSTGDYTSSPSGGDGGPAHLEDNNSGTKWGTNSMPYYVTYDFGMPQIFTSYNWATANDSANYANGGRNPQKWEILGSNDDVNWTVVDDRTTAQGYGPLANYTWAGTNPNGYLAFDGSQNGGAANAYPLSVGGSLPLNSPVSIGAQGTVDLGGVNSTFASLSDGSGGGGSVINSNTGATAVLTLAPRAARPPSAARSGTRLRVAAAHWARSTSLCPATAPRSSPAPTSARRRPPSRAACWTSPARARAPARPTSQRASSAWTGPASASVLNVTQNSDGTGQGSGQLAGSGAIALTGSDGMYYNSTAASTFSGDITAPSGGLRSITARSSSAARTTLPSARRSWAARWFCGQPGACRRFELDRRCRRGGVLQYVNRRGRAACGFAGRGGCRGSRTGNLGAVERGWTRCGSCSVAAGKELR